MLNCIKDSYEKTNLQVVLTDVWGKHNIGFGIPNEYPVGRKKLS